MSMIGFPLLLIPLAICNIIIFLMPGVLLTAPVFTLTLMSGVRMAGDARRHAARARHRPVAVRDHQGLRPGGKYLTDHLLSLAVFGGAAAEFVMLPQFGSSTYFMLTLLALVDLLSGVVLRARRPARAVAGPSQRVPEAEACEPRFDPAPVSWRHRFHRLRLPRVQRVVAEPVPKSARRSFMARLPEPNGIRTFRRLDIQPGSETPMPSDQSRR